MRREIRADYPIASGGFHKRRKQPPRQRIAAEHPFGMPLNADDKAMVGSFEGFDDAIFRPGRRCQPIGGTFDGLMMIAVDRRLVCPQDLRQPAVRSYPHPMGRLLPGRFGHFVVVLVGRGHLRRDILIEAASRGDVEGLDAAADAEDGQIGRQRPARDRQFGDVAGAIHLPQFRMPRLAIFRRIDIDAAGKQQAIQSLEDRAQRLFGQAERDDHRRRARCCQRRGVEAVHAVGRQIHVCGILIGRGRDADERTRR